ncbi:MAG: hypothetical protein HY023_18725 [Chloroflexi bacterium]|nr:hypothetical protein [Chloroflexota bacterium]MBI3761360.1 hypothetical protein [Chloroflexota bacterium]
MGQPEDDAEFEQMDHPQLRAYLKRLEINLAQVKRRLREFEARFGAETEEMFSRVSAAEIEADSDLSEWAGEREMMRRLEEQRAALKKRLE